MSEFEDLYSVLQTQASAGSGRGGSYWAISATCGLKGRLYEHFQALDQEVEYDPKAQTPTGRPKVTGKYAGSFYHAFQQYWRTGKFSTPTALSVSHEDINYETAANCFQAYRRRCGNDPNNRGTVLDAEVKSPANPEEEALVRAALGDIPFTIRHDLRVHVDAALVDRFLTEDGIVLPGPGDYLVDHKLVQSISEETINGYRYGFQSISYLTTYNLCHPQSPVRGILYDVMARVKKPEPHHFQLILAEVPDNALDIVRDGLRLAKEQHDAGRASPLMCDKTAFGACKLMTNGQCPRAGSFDDYKWGAKLGEWERK
jgi:hypothetical protein